MRSPRRAPPVRRLEGSTAITPTVRPRARPDRRRDRRRSLEPPHRRRPPRRPHPRALRLSPVPSPLDGRAGSASAAWRRRPAPASWCWAAPTTWWRRRPVRVRRGGPGHTLAFVTQPGAGDLLQFMKASIELPDVFVVNKADQASPSARRGSRGGPRPRRAQREAPGPPRVVVGVGPRRPGRRRPARGPGEPLRVALRGATRAERRSGVATASVEETLAIRYGSYGLASVGAPPPSRTASPRPGFRASPWLGASAARSRRPSASDAHRPARGPAGAARRPRRGPRGGNADPAALRASRPYCRRPSPRRGRPSSTSSRPARRLDPRQHEEQVGIGGSGSAARRGSSDSLRARATARRSAPRRTVRARGSPPPPRCRPAARSAEAERARPRRRRCAARGRRRPPGGGRDLALRTARGVRRRELGAESEEARLELRDRGGAREGPPPRRGWRSARRRRRRPRRAGGPWRRARRRRDRSHRRRRAGVYTFTARSPLLRRRRAASSAPPATGTRRRRLRGRCPRHRAPGGAGPRSCAAAASTSSRVAPARACWRIQSRSSSAWAVGEGAAGAVAPQAAARAGVGGRGTGEGARRRLHLGRSQVELAGAVGALADLLARRIGHHPGAGRNRLGGVSVPVHDARAPRSPSPRRGWGPRRLMVTSSPRVG